MVHGSIDIQTKLHELIAKHQGDGNAILREHLRRRGKNHREITGVQLLGATTQIVKYPSDAWNATSVLYSSLFGIPVTINDVAQDGQIGDCYLMAPMAMLAIGALMGANGKALDPKTFFAPVAGQPNQVAVTLYTSAGAVQLIMQLQFDALQQGGLATTNTWSKILEIGFAAIRTAEGTEAGLTSGWFSEAFTAFNAKQLSSSLPALNSYAAIRAALQGGSPLAIFWGSGSQPSNGYPASHAWAVLPESWQIALGVDNVNLFGWNPWGPGITEDPNRLPASSLPGNGSFAACYGATPTYTPAPAPKPTAGAIATTLASDKSSAAPGESVTFTWTASPTPAQLFLLIPGFPNVPLPASASGSQTITMPTTTAKSIQFQLFWVAADGSQNYGAIRAMDVAASPSPTPAPSPSPSPSPTPSAPVLTVVVNGSQAYSGPITANTTVTINAAPPPAPVVTVK